MLDASQGVLDLVSWEVVLLACRLLYGSDLRLLECLQLRVKDIEFERNEITVRDGKGQLDRVTILPASCKQPLRAQRANVRRMHENDLRQAWVKGTPFSGPPA